MSVRLGPNRPGKTCRVKVFDLLLLLKRDGWYLAATRGSHRQYKHLFKEGRVTVFNGGVTTIFAIEGGFADVTPDGLTILAEKAQEVTA